MLSWYKLCILYTYIYTLAKNKTIFTQIHNICEEMRSSINFSLVEDRLNPSFCTKPEPSYFSSQFHPGFTLSCHVFVFTASQHFFIHLSYIALPTLTWMRSRGRALLDWQGRFMPASFPVGARAALPASVGISQSLVALANLHAAFGWKVRGLIDALHYLLFNH